MLRKILAAAGFVVLASAAQAQTPVLNPVTPLTGTAGSGGSASPVSPANPLPVAAGPYQASPSSTANSDQHNLAITAATALTVPADALAAQVCVTGTKVNYRWDGTAPTSSVGQPLLSGQCFFFAGRNILAALQFIQTAATATLDVTYSK